jgi:hypothetical protein
MTQDVEMPRIANATIEPEEHDEIAATEEMIRAACQELALCESGDPPWSTVKAIYRAMEFVRRK